MITFMTTFKPFDGDDEIRQRNALLSWLLLDKKSEVFVFGTPQAPYDLSELYNIKNYPLVVWNNTGMPRIDEMFYISQRDSKNNYLAYVNGDVVLGPDFLKTISTIACKKFLLVGQRWDTDYLVPIDKATCEAVQLYRENALNTGDLRGPTGIDYFAFPKSTFKKVPPLVPGGVIWDGYMIYYAKKQGIPVIDATHDILAIHQNHSYKLINTEERELDAGPAARNNFSVASSDDPTCIYTPYTTENSDLFMKNEKLYSTHLSYPYLKHRIKQYMIYLARNTGLYQILKR